MGNVNSMLVKLDDSNPHLFVWNPNFSGTSNRAQKFEKFSTELKEYHTRRSMEKFDKMPKWQRQLVKDYGPAVVDQLLAHYKTKEAMVKKLSEIRNPPLKKINRRLRNTDIKELF